VIVICDTGYRQILGISTEQATLLALIPQYGSGLVCVFACGKLLSAMAGSKIFPTIFTKRSLDNSPLFALVAGSLVGFVVILVNKYFVGNLLFFYNATLVLAFIFYVPQCGGFIVLRTKMTSVPRNYRSPVGIPGAVYAIVMNVVGIISCFFFQDDKYLTLYAFIVFVGICTIYYVAYVRHKQTFSPEEREVMFVAHVHTSGMRAFGQF
jgi:ethanolamine permease